MLIIVAGMSRSGSTWMYQVLSELLQRRHPDFLGLGYQAIPDPLQIAPEQYAIVKWHEACPVSIAALQPARVRIVYSYRDLRNVAYSYADKSLAPLSAACVQLPYLIQLNAFWDAMQPVVSMRYESFWQDSRPWVQALADQVGEFTAAEIDEVNAAFSFAANRKRTAADMADLILRGVPLHDLSKSCANAHSRLLHWNHLRNGEGYEWRNAAEPELRQLDRLLTPWLISKGYEQSADWVDRLLAARAQQGGCDGKEAAETQADSQRERGTQDGDPAASSSSGGSHPVCEHDG